MSKTKVKKIEKKSNKKPEKGKKENKEKNEDKKENNSGPVLSTRKDRKIDDKEFQKYEEMLNKKTHRPKKDSNKKK